MVVRSIAEMVHHPKYPRSLLALQEMSPIVYEQLQKQLPTTMCFIPKTPEEVDTVGQSVFIYDSNLFEFIDYQCSHYHLRKHSTYMTLTLKEKASGLLYRFVQSHIPGGPTDSGPARQEFAEAVLRDFKPEAMTILMGDMNRSPDYIMNALQQVNPQNGFAIISVPYPTHIDTFREAAWIDNILIASSCHRGLYVRVSNSTDFFPAVKKTVGLLKHIEFTIGAALSF